MHQRLEGTENTLLAFSSPTPAPQLSPIFFSTGSLLCDRCSHAPKKLLVQPTEALKLSQSHQQSRKEERMCLLCVNFRPPFSFFLPQCCSRIQRHPRSLEIYIFDFVEQRVEPCRVLSDIKSYFNEALICALILHLVLRCNEHALAHKLMLNNTKDERRVWFWLAHVSSSHTLALLSRWYSVSPLLLTFLIWSGSRWEVSHSLLSPHNSECDLAFLSRYITFTHFHNTALWSCV